MLKSVETHSISVSWPICNESVWCVLVFSSLLNIFWLSPFCIPIVFQSGVFNVFLFHFLFYFGTALSCVYCVQSLLVPCLTASSTPVLICSSSLLWRLLSIFLFSSRVTYLYLWTLLSSAFLDWCYVSIKICLFKKTNKLCLRLGPAIKMGQDRPGLLPNCFQVQSHRCIWRTIRFMTSMFSTAKREVRKWLRENLYFLLVYMKLHDQSSSSIRPGGR